MQSGKMCKILALFFATSMIVTGCATDDKISISSKRGEDDYDAIISYASSLLLKHSYNRTEKLVKVKMTDEDWKPEETDNGEVEINDDAAKSNSSANADASQKEAAKEKDSEESSVKESGKESSKDETAKESKEENASKSTNLGDVSASISKHIEGLQLSYDGYEVAKNYPKDKKQGRVTAGKGKNLLVLKFTLKNPTDKDVKLNMNKKKTVVQGTLNNTGIGYCEMTMLEEDFSSFYGTIKAKNEKKVVILWKVPEKITDKVTKISLKLKIDNETFDLSIM